MTITFTKDQLAKEDFLLRREWLEIDAQGNYALSSLLGVNTRKKHGLFVVKNQNLTPPMVLLSQLHEEINIGGQKHDLFSAEYQNHKAFPGLKNLSKFDLDPVPTYLFQCGGVEITKSIVLLRNTSQLILSYKISGNISRTDRLVIRPFFAFRSIDAVCNREDFENTEVFLMKHGLRFLPFRDAPEVFMYYPEGQFINSPVWYQNFYYRHDKPEDHQVEDLLNPGFFEFLIHQQKQIFLTFSLSELPIDQIEKNFNQEWERRQLYLAPRKEKNAAVTYLSGRIQNFQRSRKDSAQYLVTDLMDNQLYLSLHCLMSMRLFKVTHNREQARKYYDDLSKLVMNDRLPEILMGMDPTIKVEPATPFFIIFFLYRYHLMFDQGESVSRSVNLIFEILSLIRKNRLMYYQLRRDHLLERQYRKSDFQEKDNYEIFFPVRQNFLLNIFWYNALRMGVYLAELKEMRVPRFARWTKKIKQRFHQQYLRTFLANPMQAPESYSFAFHPSLIYTITLPFPMLEERDSQVFYRILIKQFLMNGGIKFPARTEASFFLSPILLGDYFDGWELLMKNKEFLFTFFQSISQKLLSEMQTGMLGYMPNIFSPESSAYPVPPRASGVATVEVMYFLTRLAEAAKKTRHTPKPTP